MNPTFQLKGRLPAAAYFAVEFILCFCIFLFFVPPSLARPRYAKQTGLACKACHINPHGGGTLTKTGAQFRDDGYVLKEPPPSSHLKAWIIALAGGLVLLLFLFLLTRRFKRRV